MMASVGFLWDGRAGQSPNEGSSGKMKGRINTRGKKGAIQYVPNDHDKEEESPQKIKKKKKQH